MNQRFTPKCALSKVNEEKERRVQEARKNEELARQAQEAREKIYIQSLKNQEYNELRQRMNEFTKDSGIHILEFSVYTAVIVREKNKKEDEDVSMASQKEPQPSTSTPFRQRKEKTPLGKATIRINTIKAVSQKQLAICEKQPKPEPRSTIKENIGAINALLFPIKEGTPVIKPRVRTSRVKEDLFGKLD